MTGKIISLLLAVLMLTGAFAAAGAETAGEGRTWYVYTENGKPLNVRILPEGEIVGKIACGEQVQVVSVQNDTWAEITFHYSHPENGEGDWPAYVNRRYLTDIEPGELKKLQEAEAVFFTGDPMTDINKEFASAQSVTPYEISIRPARVTGVVNMRWIPSETGAIIAQYKATEKLNVLKELTYFLMVQDPDTGDVGYIHRRYAVK